MKVLVSVFNNLYTDQRVEKICRTLHENGFEIELIGNNWGGAPEMQRPYKFSRISLNSKILRFAYIEFNRKLYKELLKRADQNTILLSNDLDTVLPNYFASKKLGISMVFDSHEIFTEMPSVNGRWVQKIWRLVEKFTIPKQRYMMTASESYADWFVKKYGIGKSVVVQNFPRKISQPLDYYAKNERKIILYQGVINPSRGLDKVIPAMAKIENAELWIAGDGPQKDNYQNLTEKLSLQHKVKFLGKLLPEDLRKITVNADVGLSIEENNGESYYYSLPNKVSDYIQARVPVVVSNFPEMTKIVEKYRVGEIIQNHSEDQLVTVLQKVLNQGKNFYRESLEKASNELNWENEEPKIIALFEKVKQEIFRG